MNLKQITAPIATQLEEFNGILRSTPLSNIGLLNTVIRYVLRQKGKQIRPALVLLSAEATGGVTPDTHIAATLVELLHTATLIHDDVVDESATRRGVASVNAIWKNKVAILVGDYLLSRGLLLSMEHNRADFLKITSTAVRRMSEGELLQIQKSRTLNIDEDVYYSIIADKTASLIATCCELGAASTSASQTARDRMRDFGERLGMAFQIRDDVFDYVSRRSQIGKPVGIDLKEKKLTLPLIHALKRAPKKDAKAVMAMIKEKKGSKTRSLVGAFVQEHGGIEYAMERAEAFAQEALALLSPIAESPAKAALVDLVQFTITREH